MLTSFTVISDIVYCNALIMSFILLCLFNFICSSPLLSDWVLHKYSRFRRANTIVL